jgi:hypothetical protein
MNARNLIWSDADHTAIDCEVEHEIYGWIPFTASPSDVAAHGREIFEQCASGEFGIIAEYIPPTSEELAASARVKRDALLAASDWSQAGDVPQATKDLWIPYRQALRDVPEQAGFPSEIIWPTKP